MLNNALRMPYMLNERHFMLTLAATLLLHMGAFIIWQAQPKQKVHDITIRSLNIRLGEADELELQQDMAVNQSNNPQVENLIDKIAKQALTALPAPPQNNMVKQYVREVNAPRSKQMGVKNGVRDAEIISRYTQVISLWIQKFKRYPAEAREQNLQGNAVVRIRIDRHGNIRYHALELSTGIVLLDQAAIDMIRRANPVPAIPNDYPEGETFEFLIPVNFSLS